jgi:hypothetical protein
VERLRARPPIAKTSLRNRVVVAAAGLLILLSGCLQPEPPSPEPSAQASASESVDPLADVTITVGDLGISYGINVCPVTAWLDPEIEDSVSFGLYPEYVTAGDGGRWSTHMLVLRMANGTPVEWDFILTTPLSGIPGDTERSLISRQGVSGSELDNTLSATITDGAATFRTAFWDSQDPDPVPPLAGSATVTCR